MEGAAEIARTAEPSVTRFEARVRRLLPADIRGPVDDGHHTLVRLERHADFGRVVRGQPPCRRERQDEPDTCVRSVEGRFVGQLPRELWTMQMHAATHVSAAACS